MHGPPRPYESKEPFKQLKENRVEVRTNARDVMRLQQNLMLKNNEKECRYERRCRPKPKVEVWVLRFDIQGKNKQYCQHVEPVVIKSCVDEDLYLVT